MVTERKKYPIRPEDYEIYEDIGQGVTATVYRARCIPFNEIVAIKILDLERTNNDLSNISREAQTMILINHPNLLNAHCSFGNDKTLWVVMPYMGGGSCLHMLQSAYPEGFEEVVIATVLREVLSGLEYLHSHGHIHRDVKAGNILLDASAGIKLGDFGVSASLFDSGHRQRMRNTFVGTPCWMAPEVMEQLNGYDFKADIWSFGITALELAHGHAPFSKFSPIKVLLMTLQNAPPSLENDKKFSRAFKQMVARCLVKNPSERPTAHKLLKHNFFKQARSNIYIARNLLEGLPPLNDRIKALKEKEQRMLAQKKMPDVKKEELSQNEYKRGISGWNFDLEDLRIQAALVQDEDFTCDKETCGSGNSTVELGSTHMSKCASTSSSCSSNELDKEYIEINQIMQGKQSTTVSEQLPMNHRLKSNAADNGASSASSSCQKALHGGSHHCRHSEMGTNSTVISGAETNGKHVETVSSDAANGTRGTTCRSASLEATQTLPKEESAAIPPTANGVVSYDAISKASKTPAISEDTDAKSKIPVVQQKGRFKVTSENMELDKVPPPSPGITKCLSLQAIPQAAALNLPSPIGPRPHLPGSAPFQHLLYFLQENVNKREYILNAMKQLTPADLSANPSTDTSTSQSSTNPTEKSLIMYLEAAHEREKELMQQVTDLQSRLSFGREEPQRLKPRNLSRITSFNGV